MLWSVLPKDSDILHYGKPGMKWGIVNKKQTGASKKTGRTMSGSSKKGNDYGEYDIHPDFNTAMRKGVTYKDLDEMEEAMWAIKNRRRPNWKAIDKVLLKMNQKERNSFINRMKNFNKNLYNELNKRYMTPQKKTVGSMVTIKNSKGGNIRY